MATLFKHYPAKPTAPECDRAFLILCNAHDASSSFLDIFRAVRNARKARGMSTDEEQDLLRAMLAFATAGIDSMVKRLVVDALASVVDKDEGAQSMFTTFVERRLSRSGALDPAFVAMALTSKDPRKKLIGALVRELTSGSLQSTDELLKVGSFFNIPSADLTSNPAQLTKIFRIRNEIVHEMDIDFTQRNRNRRPRGAGQMIDHTNVVFSVAAAFLNQTNERLT